MTTATGAYASAVSHILADQLVEFAATSPESNIFAQPPQQALQDLFGMSPEAQPEVWIMRANSVLGRAQARTGAVNGHGTNGVPDLVKAALKVWSEPGNWDAKKEHIRGVRIYLESIFPDAVIEAKQRSRGVSPRSIAPTPLAVPPIVAPIRPKAPETMEDGGLSILRGIVNRAPKVGVMAYLRHAIDRERHPIAVAKAFQVTNFGHLDLVNPAFCERFGWTEDDIKKLSVADFLHPKDSFVRAGLQMLLGMGEFKARPVRGLKGSARHVPLDERSDEHYLRCKGAGKLWNGYALGLFTEFPNP